MNPSTCFVVVMLTVIPVVLCLPPFTPDGYRPNRGSKRGTADFLEVVAKQLKEIEDQAAMADLYEEDVSPAACPNPDPCVHGSCSTKHDPFGWGYYCDCPKSMGGTFCQFVDPCAKHPCPKEKPLCHPDIHNNRNGRQCFGAEYFQG